MTQPTVSWVVDASVAAQLYIPEPLTTQAIAFFDQLVADPATCFAVPDLFFIECANIFWKRSRRGDITVSAAVAALANIQALRLQSTPTAILAPDALRIALDHGVTAYDACYVALAHRLNVSHVTADERLVQRLSGTPFQVVSLGAWSPSQPPGP